MNKKDFTITTQRNDLLHVSLFGAEDLNKGRLIIFVHGFKGFKDWGFGPYLGEHFAQAGIPALMFNFSHNGTGDSLTEFVELEKFAENTFSLEISELNEIIDAVLDGRFGHAGKISIGVLGHSRGGAIAILTASQRKEVSSAALWASISRVDRYSQRQKSQWREKGYLEVKNMRTKQIMRLNVSLLDDVENNAKQLNIRNAVKNFGRPLFLAHGEQDLAVPVREADELYQLSDRNITEYFKIPATGHTFDISHPFSGSSEKFDELLKKTCGFFDKTLK